MSFESKIYSKYLKRKVHTGTGLRKIAFRNCEAITETNRKINMPEVNDCFLASETKTIAIRQIMHSCLIYKPKSIFGYQMNSFFVSDKKLSFLAIFRQP
jgi:hypothetical protein